jgi:hypothetical protein
LRPDAKASLKSPADERLSFSRSPTKRSSRSALSWRAISSREILPPFGHWRYSLATAQFSFWAERMYPKNAPYGVSRR